MLPLYRKGGEIDTDPHFMMFFNYYCKCSNEEVDDFIEFIKDYEFLTYYEQDDEQAYRGSAHLCIYQLRISVVEEDRIIYISSDMFKLYEHGLSEPDGIRLKKSFC